MVSKLLRKNPIERLGSQHYQDLREHSFFRGFNWLEMSTTKFFCDIPAIAEAMAGGAGERGAARESVKKQRAASNIKGNTGSVEKKTDKFCE